MPPLGYSKERAVHHVYPQVLFNKIQIKLTQFLAFLHSVSFIQRVTYIRQWRVQAYHSVFNFQGKQGDSGHRENIEDVIEDNFLVDTQTIGSRKTSLVTANRVRDHKLQVLYRMEIHWLLASQEKQRRIESGILAHLRQVSIWETETSGPEEMAKFMNECVTRNYINHSSDLLVSLILILINVCSHFPPKRGKVQGGWVAASRQFSF